MHDNTILLSDGRKIGYVVYGDREGFPVLFFHGTPGSRLLFNEDDPVAAELGIRLIALDRPGFGLSDAKPGRAILDWPDDVREAADRLGLDRFAVIGVSGGGAYAAACAYRLPDRVRSAVLISSVAPFRNGKPPKDMMPTNKAAFFLSRRAPWLLKISFRAQKKLLLTQPEKFMKSIKDGNRHLHERDRQYLQTEEQLRMYMMHLGEAFRVSVDECATEPALIAKPWGFELADIRVPIDVWHGAEDTMAPCSEMQQAAAAIPDCRVHIIPGAGHFLMDDEQVWRGILEGVWGWGVYAYN